MDAFLAIDVGGTSIKVEVQRPDGTALSSARRPTVSVAGTLPGVDGVVDALVEATEEALVACPAGSVVVSAGVVVPGIVDPAHGVAVRSVNLGWENVPVGRMLVERLGLPVRLGHDVFSAGRAEIERGAARGVDSAVVVVIGTGLSAVFTSGGRVLRGGLGQAGELGHLVVRPGGPECGCGRRGCVETIASASAIVRQYAERSRPRAPADAVRGGSVRVGRSELVGSVQVGSVQVGSVQVDSAQVVALAEAGDPIAARVWREAVAALGDALLSVTTLLAPSVIVIGGGLAEAGERLLGPLREHLGSRVTFERVPELRPARFGARGGVVGAGLLAQGIGELG